MGIDLDNGEVFFFKNATVTVSTVSVEVISVYGDLKFPRSSISEMRFIQWENENEKDS